MDMLDPGLDTAATSAAPSHEKSQEAEEGVDLQEGEGAPGEEGAVAIASVPVPGGAFADAGLQYQFRTESNGGQVTYRVVQVTEAPIDGPEGAAVSVVSTFAGAPQAVAQAVIQNPFSNGGSPGGEGGAEGRFAWGGDGAVSVQADPALAQAGGQFYVMMTPQDVLQPGAQRSIAPRGHPYSPKMDGTRVPRDERRRAQHNEVERRRRDKINNWIVQLSKIIPDCNADNSKTGASKGGILSKACDYVRELRQSNQRLQEAFKEAERLQMDNDLLRQQVEELQSENAVLRAQLQQRGLEGGPEGGAPVTPPGSPPWGPPLRGHPPPGTPPPRGEPPPGAPGEGVSGGLPPPPPPPWGCPPPSSGPPPHPLWGCRTPNPAKSHKTAPPPSAPPPG